MKILFHMFDAQLLGFINFGFALFSGLVGLSLIFMLTNKNLVYSVLNLAVLSVFLILMWMYYLEVNFILIVYILAFIGAIVMLFLSVVLMLPSSTFEEKAAAQGLCVPLFLSPLYSRGDELTAECFNIVWSNIYLVFFVNVVAVVGFLCLAKARRAFLWNALKKGLLLYERAAVVVRPWISHFLERLLFWLTPSKVAQREGYQGNASLFKKTAITLLNRVNPQKWPWEKIYTALNRITIPSTRAIETALCNRWSLMQKTVFPFFEFIGQAFYKLFFISIIILIPNNNTRLGLFNQSGPVHFENLIAIKSILYVEQPLLLILSVIGLLVALFGVTAVVSNQKQVTESK